MRTESEKEEIYLAQLEEENILSEEEQKAHEEEIKQVLDDFMDRNIVDLCKFVCTHTIVVLSFRFNYNSNRDKEKRGKHCPCFCPFHEEFEPFLNLILKERNFKK